MRQVRGDFRCIYLQGTGSGFCEANSQQKRQILTLTPTEFNLLELFCRNPNRILSKEILLEKVWDDRGNYVNDHALTLNISRLRGKLEDGENTYIKTVYGMGYEWMGGSR